MDEDRLYTLTYTELIELLNQTRQDYLYYPRNSIEAKERKNEMDLILRTIAARRANEHPLKYI